MTDGLVYTNRWILWILTDETQDDKENIIVLLLELALKASCDRLFALWPLCFYLQGIFETSAVRANSPFGITEQKHL